jgi:hypothetical protein
MKGETETSARPRCGYDRTLWGKADHYAGGRSDPPDWLCAVGSGCVGPPVRPAPPQEDDEGPIHKVFQETCRRGCEETFIGQTKGAHTAVYVVRPAQAPNAIESTCHVRTRFDLDDDWNAIESSRWETVSILSTPKFRWVIIIHALLNPSDRIDQGLPGYH